MEELIFRILWYFQDTVFIVANSHLQKTIVLQSYKVSFSRGLLRNGEKIIHMLYIMLVQRN